MVREIIHNLIIYIFWKVEGGYFFIVYAFFLPMHSSTEINEFLAFDFKVDSKIKQSWSWGCSLFHSVGPLTEKIPGVSPIFTMHIHD